MNRHANIGRYKLMSLKSDDIPCNWDQGILKYICESSNSFNVILYAHQMAYWGDVKHYAGDWLMLLKILYMRLCILFRALHART